MALRDEWIDRVPNVDPAAAEDINAVANAVIELEDSVDDLKEKVENIKINTFLITFTASEDGEIFADKTIQECLEIYNKGEEVEAVLNGLDEHYKGRLAFVESYEDEPTQIASVVFMLDSILDFTNKMKVYALADDNFEYFYQQKKTLVAWDELPVYNGEVIE